jgi:dipeptidyl-peptidase-4
MAFFLGVGLAVIAGFVSAQETKESEREAMYRRYLEFPSKVKSASVQPHWMADGSSFWYAEGAAGSTVIYKVDPKANTRIPLFDSGRLRKALTPALGHEPPYQGLPFEEFSFLNAEKAVEFAVEDKEFVLQLDTYSITRARVLSEDDRNHLKPRAREVLSPDRSWFAGVQDYNIYLRSTADGRTMQATSDGIKGYNWDYSDYFEEEARWSPDSRQLAVMKMDSRQADSMPIVHWLTPKVDLRWWSWPRADGHLETNELFIIDIRSKRQVRINTGDEPDHRIWILGWGPNGSELHFLRMDREYKKLELMAADPASGATRIVLTETQKTFVRGFQYGWPGGFDLLPDGKRFLWMSERDSWNHLYLYRLDGSFIRHLTEGTFPVDRVIAVDEKTGWVYFTAHADRQRPYDTHLYRVNLEGKNFTRLTETTGQHDIQFAPSKEFFLDTHSSVTRPPVVELRRADGKLLRTLAAANTQYTDALNELQLRLPEEFVVKAADGKTDLFGVLYHPYDFDPGKKYPVIDFIYAGPTDVAVPQTFTSNFAQAVAQLGFVTLSVDGRGTPDRGKEFQDVVYGNLGRYEIPDHVAALKQLAEKRRYIDLNRVGIVGRSWGGHFALRAMLQAPEVYQVGVAGAPDIDLYDHLPNDVEPWLGQPHKNKAAYDYGSNYWLAGNLRGKLLLIHGTSDVNVPFSVTMRMADALIRAGKFFDLIVLPEGTHRSSDYSREATRRYFQEHLKPE